MKIVFAGTPEFAAVALDAIVNAAASAGWTVPLVLTQPDRAAGRGMKLAASPVKQLALAHGIEVDTPSSLRKGESAAAAHALLKAIAPDVLVVAAYGLILPQSVLDIPRGLRDGWVPKLSALNIHASLLPRWRGAAPIARAIEAGDAETGITIMQMDAGLDTGPMLAAEKVAIAVGRYRWCADLEACTGRSAPDRRGALQHRSAGRDTAAERCDVRHQIEQVGGVAGLVGLRRAARAQGAGVQSVSDRIEPAQWHDGSHMARARERRSGGR